MIESVFQRQTYSISKRFSTFERTSSKNWLYFNVNQFFNSKYYSVFMRETAWNRFHFCAFDNVVCDLATDAQPKMNSWPIWAQKVPKEASIRVFLNFMLYMNIRLSDTFSRYVCYAPDGLFWLNLYIYIFLNRFVHGYRHHTANRWCFRKGL